MNDLSPQNNKTKMQQTVLHRVALLKTMDMSVEALEQGFAFQGITYRSLSAVAYAITGTKWNGNVFFGLKKAGKANGK